MTFWDFADKHSLVVMLVSIVALLAAIDIVNALTRGGK